MKLRYSFLGVALVILPFLQTCSGMELAILGNRLTTHNQRIHDARENLRRDAEIVKSHDLKRVQAEIDKQPHKFEWRITKSALQVAQGDDEGARQSALEAISTPEAASYDDDTRRQINIARVRQVRDSYAGGTQEYGRVHAVYCDTIRKYNQDFSAQAAQRYDVTGCT